MIRLVYNVVHIPRMASLLAEKWNEERNAITKTFVSARIDVTCKNTFGKN